MSDDFMIRRSTILKLLAITVLSAVTLPLLAYALLLPLIARRQIESALHHAGFRQVSFELSRITPWNMEINGLKMDDWRIENARVDYTPASLLDSRVRTINIHGAQIIFDPTFTPPTTAPIGSEAEPLQLNLPLDRLDVTDSVIVIRSTSSEPVHLAVEARLQPHVDRPYDVEIALNIGDEPVMITGTLDPIGQRAEATVHAPALAAEETAAIIAAILNVPPFDAEGNINLHGEFTFANQQSSWNVRLEPTDVWLSMKKPPNDAGANLGWHGGVLSMNGRTDPNGASVAITMDQLELESDSSDLEIEGLSGGVTLTSLSPIQTPPAQQLTIDRLRSGEMIFHEGSIDFSVTGQTVFEIQRTQWRWLDGTLWAENARIDPSSASIDATVQASGIQLKGLLELFADEYARGQGRVNATLPVQVRGWRVGFGQGHVTGEGSGTIQILDAGKIAESVADSHDANQTAIRDQVAQALSDFEYDVLQARLAVEDDRGLMARVRFSGRGKSGARRAVNFELNIDGLDQLLLYYLGIRRHLSQN